MDSDNVETSRLKRLLLAIATTDAEPPGIFKLDAYDISAAITSLNGRPGASPDEIAHLEFLYLGALENSAHGIPNLERQIAESPALFVQVVALAFKRSDDREDPPESRVDDPAQRASLASAAYRLLDRITRIPGTDSDGNVSTAALLQWLTEVRRLLQDQARVEIGDDRIGNLLSKAPVGDDGVWPCVPVRDAMEAIGSEEMSQGFKTGVHNARGAYYRGEGGAQERELASKYRGWAQRLAFDYPYMSSVLEAIAASYDREAEWHDSDAKVRKRLSH